MGYKGSWQRHRFVSRDERDANWERTFRSNPQDVIQDLLQHHGGNVKAKAVPNPPGKSVPLDQDSRAEQLVQVQPGARR